MTAAWGSFLHTGRVQVKNVTEDVRAWRDTRETAVPPALDRAGQNHVRGRIRDLVIVGSRPTVPPACHVEVPSA